VVAEAWYPGWRAEIDGRECPCVPANAWMRAIPVPAGRHQVRLHFRQDYLLPGLLISVLSAGLIVAVLAKAGRRVPSTAGRQDASQVPAAAGASETVGLGADGRPAPAQAGGASNDRQRVGAVAAVALGLLLVAFIGIKRMQVFHAAASTVDCEAECHLAMTYHMQHQMAQAIAHYHETLRLNPDHTVALNNLAWIRAANAQAEFRDGPEAVRLAQRACELSGYREPMSVQTLATALAEAGRFEEAVAVAQQARQLALAGGQSQLAEIDLKLVQIFTSRHPYRESARN